VKRKQCLTRSTDFLRVKRTGNSFANPFMALIAAPNYLSFSRFAIAAGRSVGNAVLRGKKADEVMPGNHITTGSTWVGFDFLWTKTISTGKIQ
jgi:hypothetical protein